MPELPDVETWKRYVDSTSLHQRIEDIELPAPRIVHDTTARSLHQRLKGASLERTQRHGKYLFVELGQNSGWLLMHFGMTGRLTYYKNQDDLPKHTGLLIRFVNGYQLAYVSQRKLGRVGLVGSPPEFIQEQELGPDAFSPGIPLDEFRRMLAERRGAIKSALMDQNFIAGIGNIYSDEILFQARIHPRATTRRLDDDETAALHRAMRRVLRIAIERQADPERLPDSWLLPHRGEDGACPRCGTRLEHLATAGRTAVFCPHCQGGGQ